MDKWLNEFESSAPDFEDAIQTGSCSNIRKLSSIFSTSHPYPRAQTGELQCSGETLPERDGTPSTLTNLRASELWACAEKRARLSRCLEGIMGSLRGGARKEPGRPGDLGSTHRGLPRHAQRGVPPASSRGTAGDCQRCACVKRRWGRDLCVSQWFQPTEVSRHCVIRPVSGKLSAVIIKSWNKEPLPVLIKLTLSWGRDDLKICHGADVQRTAPPTQWPLGTVWECHRVPHTFLSMSGYLY